MGLGTWAPGSGGTDLSLCLSRLGLSFLPLLQLLPCFLLPLFSGMAASGPFPPSQSVTVPKTSWHRFESLNLNYGLSGKKIGLTQFGC